MAGEVQDGNKVERMSSQTLGDGLRVDRRCHWALKKGGEGLNRQVPVPSHRTLCGEVLWALNYPDNLGRLTGTHVRGSRPQTKDSNWESEPLDFRWPAGYAERVRLIDARCTCTCLSSVDSMYVKTSHNQTTN